MKAIRLVNNTKEELCEVKFYILVKPVSDQHFRRERNYVLDYRYFDTKEEAEEYLSKEELPIYANYEICEKIIKIY